MGSERLKQIQAAVQRLIDAQTAGSAAEIAAAQALLNTPLSSDLTPLQILEAGKARLGKFEQAVQRQGDIGTWAEAATAGMATAAANLERPDRLAVTPEKIDSGIEAALGIAAQTGQFFLDPETGTLILGRGVGELTSAMVRLAGVLKPGEEISPAGIAERLGVKPSSASHLLKRITEVAGDSVVQPAGRGRYGKNSSLVILGEEQSAPVLFTVAPSAEAGPPVTYSMREILKQPGIAGVLSEPQVRHLTRKLVASGHFQVGEHVVETKPQRRGKTGETVWDLEATPVGLEALRLVAEQFGAQGKIYVESVARALKKRQKPAPAAQTTDEGQRFWGAQVVADLGNVGTVALDTLQKAGILEKGKHFEVTGSGKRVYRPAAREVARRLDEAAAAAPIGRITSKFVLKTFGRPREVKPTDQPAREKYGPNGPSVLTPFHELAALRSLQQCAPKIGERLGGEISPEFSDDLGKWIAARQTELLESTPVVQVSEEEKLRIRRETAATVLKMYQDLRPFNNIREELGGLEFLVDLVKAAKQKGEIGKMIVEDFAEALVHPSVAVKNPNSPWNGGVVGGDITRVGPLA